MKNLYLFVGIFVAVVSVNTVLAVKNLGTWMSIGLQGYSVIDNPDQFNSEDQYNTIADNSRSMCRRIKGLSSGQEKLCLLYTDHAACW